MDDNLNNKICTPEIKTNTIVIFSMLCILCALIIVTIKILIYRNNIFLLIWFISAIFIGIFMTSCVFTKKNINKLREYLK